jgi:pSer/pThr/pTyr-binding forkhead associated (FHA) protein
MDPFVLTAWIVRLSFLVLLYVFLWRVARALVRDLRSAARESGSAFGRLVVLASPDGEPPVGANFLIDAVTTLGRDVNNAIVIDDQFASSEHAVLTYRGRDWYVEDLGSTNGTFVNGVQAEGVSALGYGDELQIGQVRLRLERARTTA